MQEKLKENLVKYNYHFTQEGDLIKIDMGTWQEITVNTADDKIIIEDKLKAWNILTTFPMKVKTALFLNPVFVLIFVSFISTMEESYRYTVLLIAVDILIVTFTVYYLIKLEGIKNRIAVWLNS